MKKREIRLAFLSESGYNIPCCGMIAMKREVAAHSCRFFRGANVKLGNWRQVTVQTESSTTGKEVEMTCVGIDDTHGRVYSHRLSYLH